MRKEGKYVLGTAKEIAYEIAKKLYAIWEEEGDSGLKRADCNVDFACMDISNSDGLQLDEICYNSNYWHGIKNVDTGFDSEDLELFSNYFGGGSGVYEPIYGGMTLSDMVTSAYELIKGTLEKDGSFSDADLLISEFHITPDKNV